VEKVLNKLFLGIKISLSLILILLVLVVVSSRITGNDPTFFGYQFKNVLSGSMEPTFMTGSIIQLKVTEKEGTEYKTDDVITFKSENILITHRIKDIIYNGDDVMYITQGDNNDGPDQEPVKADSIIGKYTGFTIPYLGYVFGFASSKLGALVLLLIPGFIFLGYSYYFIHQINIKKNIQSKNI